MKIDQIYPSFAEFKKLAKKGNLIPVGLDIMGDQVTPVSLIASRWNKSRYAFILESVEGGEKLGRYSFVSFAPDAILEEKNNQTVLRTQGSRESKKFPGTGLSNLRKIMESVKPAPVPGIPRFFGGAVGYCSYEVVQEFEKIPQTKPDDLGWPKSVFFITSDLFIFDHTQQLLKIITCAKIGPQPSLRKIYQKACQKILINLDSLKGTRTARIIPLGKNHREKSAPFETNMNRKEYVRAVKKGKEYISNGDIIQVVLSRRSFRKTASSPLDIYRSLRVVNPSPYMYLIKMGHQSIIGSSPESLVRLENGIAATRPIAGTRVRGRTQEEDIKMEKELLRDPKERAEHVMLVDLGRNDLGRVCRTGTVRVPIFMSVERYSHVMHIVSEVTGELKKNMNSFDLLSSAFPAGTVSGAPKIRAMEIIDELESAQRGPYAGALGYISYTGNMDMAITIRTILYDKGLVSIQTGGGIVADSVPEKEFQETENKAAAMKKTVELAESRRLFWDKV